jgi:putative flavoprotein involved in K+ transport
MTALPAHRYDGDDPNGFMSATETVAFLEHYRAGFAPPVLEGVTVESTTRTANGFELRAPGMSWRCDAVVAASGGSSDARVPAFANNLPRRIDQLTALQYRGPSQLASDGAVLVVGASASGVQIADELAAAGRDVTIAVGEHVRLPRSYRGRDIYEWLDRIGQLDERYDEVDDVNRARRHASVQLVGNDERRDLDVNALLGRGAHVVGRIMAVDGTRALCSGGLANLAKNADLKQTRLLRRIDEYVVEHRLGDIVGPPVDPRPTTVCDPSTELELTRFATVIWATGYRPRYAWLPPDAFDRRGRIGHDGGVGALPGLYVLGLPFLRRRRSNLISGLGIDAGELCEHLRARLDETVRGRVTLMS